MQYYKKSEPERITVDTIAREPGVIHGMLPAQDIWVFNEDPARDPDRLYMTIKNPSKPYRPAY